MDIMATKCTEVGDFNVQSRHWYVNINNNIIFTHPWDTGLFVWLIQQCSAKLTNDN